MSALACRPEPCSSCPYRRDVPSGIWHADEYAKLPLYDDGPTLNIFLCHQGTGAVCRGWLAVHADSLAVRFAILRGEIAVEQRDAPVKTPLWASGLEAARHGMRAIRRPGRAARAVMAKILRRRGAP